MSYSNERADQDGSFLIPTRTELGFRCTQCSSVMIAFDASANVVMCMACGHKSPIEAVEEVPSGDS